MLVSDLRCNVKLTAGRNPSSSSTIKISYYIFFFLKTKQFKSLDMITLCFCAFVL